MGNPMSAIIGSVTGIIVVAGTTAGILAWALLRKRRPKRQLMNPDVKYPIRLVDRQMISHDTMRIKFALESPEHILGLPVGKYVYISSRIDGETVIRPYTPITLDDQKGYVDFVIKVYKAGVNPQFPRGGKMSQFLMNLPISHCVDMRGPAGLLHYKGNGVFDIKPDNRSPPTTFTAKFVSLICGGSGITPVYQLIISILKNKADQTKLALLFANNSEDDILLRDEIELLQSKHPNQFKFWYTVSKAPERWNYSTGYIDDKMISEHCYPPGDDSLVLMCGPAPMIELACYPNLAKLNYPRERIFGY